MSFSSEWKRFISPSRAQSGASEKEIDGKTVCVCVGVCVCEREREREREINKKHLKVCMHLCEGEVEYE